MGGFHCFDAGFCIDAMNRALQSSQPEILNTDQGVQFTSTAFIGILGNKDIRISMDGRGRVFDNIFVERLWRSVKYEEVYLHQYTTVSDARHHLERYSRLYNTEQLHESLDYRTPYMVVEHVRNSL
jgi:putative transposase